MTDDKPPEVDEGIEVTIPIPDDWHVHLRDDEMLEAVAPFTAARFRYALIMPNLARPVTTVAQAVSYRQRIVAAAGPRTLPEFAPLMTLYLNDEVSIDDLVAGHEDGIIHAAKYYPAGATTNSEAGGSSLMSLRPLLEVMEERGIPLLVHAESTDPSVDVFDRERAFLDEELAPLCAEMPRLRVTVEHVSTARGIDFVRSHGGVAGSITPHHLSRDRGDLLANGLRPDLYCKPILNSPSDRAALVAAATSGEPNFFLGTDSAPHPGRDKYRANASAGIFTAPYSLEVVAEVFHQAGALDSLGTFASNSGASHYALTICCAKLRLGRRKRPLTHTNQVVTARDESSRDDSSSHENLVQVFGWEAGQRWFVERTQGGC